MHSSRLPLLCFVCLVSVALAAPAAAETPAEALARAAESYRESTQLAERLDYTVRFPDGREDRKAIEYGRAGDRLFIAMLDDAGTRIFHITAGEGRLRALQFNIGGGFVETPFEGSLVGALAVIGADRIGITVPPGLAAYEGSDDAFVESFGFGVLAAPHPVAVKTAGGVVAVTLTADAGSGVARLDAETGRLTGLSLTVGDAGSSVSLDGVFTPIELSADDPRWRVATADRRPVATFAELEAKGYPLGRAAPDLEIRALGGEVVSLGSLRGRVVILDFWATWCVPCWTALEHLEQVAEWAETAGMPISVWAVDTAEQTKTFSAQVALASEFLDSRGLDLPVLIDVDGGFFTGMHSPGLPSTVVIAPDGTLAHYHTGVGADMEEVLRSEAMALLENH